MKVLHGMSEIAGQGIYSVKGLRENGVDARLAAWRTHFGRYESDIIIGVGDNKLLYPWYALKMIIFALKAAFTFDCFHFHFGNSLLPYNLDLPLLKFLKKKLFFEFHGSELRDHMLHEVYYKYDTQPNPCPKRAKRLLNIMKYADGIILHDEELRPHLPKTDVPVYIVPLRLDLSKFIPAYESEQPEKPMIVHAPSDLNGKGTNLILEGLEHVTSPYQWVLVTGMKQEEALKIYRSSDIIIDQITVGTYGVLCIEAMALGKPCFCYISDEMRESLPESLPIISFEPENLTEKLETLLNNQELREILGKKGREYVEEYHDHVKNGKILKDIYEGKV